MGRKGAEAEAHSPCLLGEAPALHAEDLQAVVVADGDPVRLGRGPLHIVDLPFSCVGQDRVLDGPRHLLDVPDEGLMVIRCSADVAGRVWGPGNAIDTCSVVV